MIKPATGFSAPDIGGKEGKSIMKKTIYTNAPSGIGNAIEKSKIIKDFLPPPEKLVFKEENVKVTLELSKRSVGLFKKYAHKRGIKYQRMIRNLVDQYASHALR
jgi:predicted DNA binding CopG/RHH family protein